MASSPRIDELRKKFEENPRRYFAPLANEYRKAGDIEQAIDICREYLPQQPGHMSGHIVYGQALYEARQFDEAKSVFETALSLDPENLIALRHLGDIALIVGDSSGARSWYSRVLEADPRNEEIQAQLANLDQAAAAATAPTPADATTVVVPVMAHPTPTIEIPAVHPPSSPLSLSDAPTVEVQQRTPTAQPQIEKSTEATLDLPMLDVSPHAEAGPATPPEQPYSAPVATPAVTEQIPQPATQTPVSQPAATADAPPIDSFSLEGLETTEFVPPAVSPPQAPDLVVTETALPDPALEAPAASPPAEPAPPSNPVADIALLDLGEPTPRSAPAPVSADAPADAHVMATPAASPEAQQPPAEQAPWVPAPVATSTADTPPAPDAPSGLEFISMEERREPEAAAQPPAAPELPVAPEPPAAPEPLAPPEPAPAPLEAGPFVTETMAELYLKQGHREEALRVYRALLEQRPGDASLRAKVEKLTPAPAFTGPTMRDVLVIIAARRPGFRQALPRQNGATPAATPIEEAALPASALVAPAPAPAAPPTPAPSAVPEETASPSWPDLGPPSTMAMHPLSQTDQIAALFGAPVVREEDERAAKALAHAFGGANGQTSDSAPGNLPAIHGSPARPAEDDLSLDKVFGGGSSGAPSSFSFDQFFSERATGESPTAKESKAGDPSSDDDDAKAKETEDDMAQFTQWLEGLKHR